jgi:hypothetical protein
MRSLEPFADPEILGSVWHIRKHLKFRKPPLASELCASSERVGSIQNMVEDLEALYG